MVKKLLVLVLYSQLIIEANAQSNKDLVVIISLKAIAGLQYDKVRFTVKPGATIKIILTNDDEMGHNLVITQPGAREEVVDAALKLGEKGPVMNYVPGSSKVLWYIPVVDPGQSDSITFKAPRKTGIYPYVCTYPGHGFVMYGAMYVTNGTMPALTHDPNIPPTRKNDSAAELSNHLHEKRSGHSYVPAPPYLYRILLPDSGPASIAVSLPQKLSYCWDAGVCRLRYAWEGDFLDPTDYWTIKGETAARILGTVFYRDKSGYPLHINGDGKIPAVEFKGYRLIERYPEFHYAINGTDVYELIWPKPDGTGLNRTFRIPGTDKDIWFIADPGDGVRYTSTAGKWVNGQLKLSPAEARQFTITMTKETGSR